MAEPLETWLRPNRRALLFGMTGPAALGAIGAILALGLIGALDALLWRMLGCAILLGALLLIAALAWQMRLPRIGYRDGRVRFLLRSGPPIAVPVEIVEGFLMGQGPVAPGEEEDHSPQAVTVVARLSQKSDQWAHLEVKPSLGHWCDGYVTIRGAWCEPLDEEVVRRLNERLAAAQRKARNG